MIDIEMLKAQAEEGMELVEVIKKGADRDDMLIYIQKYILMAAQYAQFLINGVSDPSKAIYYLTRMYWNIGAAQGKVEMNAQLRKDKDKGKDND